VGSGALRTLRVQLWDVGGDEQAAGRVLPGMRKEKSGEWAQGTVDSLEEIMSKTRRGRYERRLVCPWCFKTYGSGNVKKELDVKRVCGDCGGKIKERFRGIVIRVERRY